MKAALTCPGSAQVGPGGFSEEPHCMETRFSFSVYALGATGGQKSLCSTRELDSQEEFKKQAWHQKPEEFLTLDH